MVHTKNVAMEFFPYPNGLNYLDLEKEQNKEILIAMTVQDNYEGHTKHEIERVVEARRL